MPIFIHQLISEKRIFFSKQESIHILKAMRMKPGDMIISTDGAGAKASGILKTAGKLAEAELIKLEHINPPKKDISLAFPLLKAQRHEAVLQQAIEIGIRTFIPLITDNTIVKKDSKKLAEKLENISQKACKQSERYWFPEIHGVHSIEQALQVGDFDNIICPLERSGKVNYLSKQLLETANNILLIIGPEGGFSEREKELLHTNANCISLGCNIMRAETAGIYTLSVLHEALSGNILS